MKTRFNSFDTACMVTELRELIGLRVNQIYDLDSKTYLIRLQGKQEKSLENETFNILIESGSRFHVTQFEWPKNNTPSGFTMKLRKHLKNKRLENVRQLEGDRIVYFEFGSKEAAYYIFLELYDRGNIILTDHEYTILYLLRPHLEGDEIRFAVREKYPLNRTRKYVQPTDKSLRDFLASINSEILLRRALIPVLEVGPSVLEHALIKYGLNDCVISNENNGGANVRKQKRISKELRNPTTNKCFEIEKNLPQLVLAVQECYDLLHKARTEIFEGYIIQKKVEVLTNNEENPKVYIQNIEFQPYNFIQFKDEMFTKFKSFCLAVDFFYSNLEEQKIDQKTLQQEQVAIKKLTNVKKDHLLRLEELGKSQEVDKIKAEIITYNQKLVDNAMLAVRSALANHMSWDDVHELIKAAQVNRDPVASVITHLKLEVNQISLKLPNPEYFIEDASENNKKNISYAIVDVDLNMNAWANARKYYDKKRMAAEKEQKTIDASEKALKNAERKTQKTLKEVQNISNITKARKIYWFEKFYWFISSENFLVVGGRDAQQNDLIVKRYMRTYDVYVHAEIQGASSVIIRNPSEDNIPPKTLLEAGTMALSYSVAWDAKVVSNVYWVKSDQVSKKAPTGEYLGTGSFMIRGKKNFLPPCNLVMGISLLFKVEDSFIERHTGERKVRAADEECEHHNVQQMRLCVESKEDSKQEYPEESLKIDLEDEIGATKVDIDKLTKFPDNSVKVEHNTGHMIIGNDKLKSLSNGAISSMGLALENQSVDDQSTTIVFAAPSRQKQQKKSKKKKEENLKYAEKIQTKDLEEVNPHNAKRGQRLKMKKLKSKYKDQDDEERQLRMKLLKPYGKNESPMSPKIEQVNKPLEHENLFQKNIEENRRCILREEAKDEESEVATNDVDVEILHALTGQPCFDDELLFAIPIVAPYQALQSYKYKIKLLPGTGKRGKAARTALEVFSKDKQCTSREKDLIRSTKEDMLARNIPGKVKVVTSTIKNFKKIK